jgi:hypothetical protein
MAAFACRRFSTARNLSDPERLREHGSKTLEKFRLLYCELLIGKQALLLQLPELLDQRQDRVRIAAARWLHRHLRGRWAVYGNWIYTLPPGIDTRQVINADHIILAAEGQRGVSTLMLAKTLDVVIERVVEFFPIAALRQFQSRA